QKIPFAPGYNVEFARRAKQATGITTISVGMITHARQAESIISNGDADMVALARGVMDDPRWVWHAARELRVETAYPRNYQRCHPSVWQP
ncbi:MAG: oxidoreductase, partial [Burkholderiales bacterium]|nr:oxidoreductase [Burkholderiales bacterium]